MGFCSLCKFLGGLNELGYGLDLEIVERKSLLFKKLYFMIGEERDMLWMVVVEVWVSYRGWDNVRNKGRR